MSGGHYDYQYSKINNLADEIESEFIDYEQTVKKNDGYDIFEGVTDKQKNDALLKIYKLIYDLRNCANRARNLEWFMSNDSSIESFLDRE